MRHIKKGNLIILIGFFMILAALAIVAYNQWDDSRASGFSARVIERLTEPDDENGKTDTFDPNAEMPVRIIDGDSYIAVLSVPVLELELPVLSEWSYPNLKKSPCRYSGSVYDDSFVIAAHNYSSHFGRLKTLSVGDQVTVTDMDGNVFSYSVATVETLKSTDTEAMKAEEWDLTLFTCTVGGQYRVTVRCERNNADSSLDIVTP